jgi:hypothetical protein
MPDDQLEAALRDTLHAEVSSAGLSISRAELHRRAERAGTGSLAMPRLLAPMLAVFVLAVGLAVVLGTRPGGFIGGPTETPTPSQSVQPGPGDSPGKTDSSSGPPEASDVPTPESLDEEAPGTVELTIDAPDGLHLVSAAVCAWSSLWPRDTSPSPNGPRVALVRTTGSMEALGERLSVFVFPIDAGPRFFVNRETVNGDNRVAYVPHPRQLAVEAAEADDGSGGLYRYADVPLTVGDSAESEQPLGNDPANTTLSISVQWICERPDPGWAPMPTVADYPPVPGDPIEATLGAEGQAERVTSETGCVDSLTFPDGTTGGDQCGTAFSQHYPPTLAVSPGQRLVLEPRLPWRLVSWQIVGYTVEAVWESQGARPATRLELSQGEVDTPTPSVEFSAPSEAGRYWIFADVVLDGDDPQAADLPLLFRVDVSGD